MQCQHPNVPANKFCSTCGQALTANALVQARDNNAAPVVYTPRHLAEQILTTRSALEGERKQVTVLFCDLPDSVGLARRLGPERMHALLNRFFELALHAIHRYGGTVNQFLGDGLMVAAAEQCLNDALSTFTAKQAHFEIGRTHLALAELAQSQGHREALTLHLSEAYQLFTALNVPGYVERTTQYASTLGLTFIAPLAPSVGEHET
jgi:class 3 adenylate cyclase